MRYVSINSVPNGSTGTVMRQVTEERIALGDECWMMWGRGRAAENDHEFNFGSKLGLYLDVLQTRLDGKAGFHSKAATKRLLKKLDEIKPDVVHLHNIHGYYVNIEMLFDWLATHKNVQVKWTLHDCWAFTGHCSHFQFVGCSCWRDGTCGRSCPQLGSYPKTISKNSCVWNYEHKKSCFLSIPPNRLGLITPSHWLEGLVGNSFLSGFPIEVRHNTIDMTVFKRTENGLREELKLRGKVVVLGVASVWTKEKGLNDFIRLRSDLDTSYVLVMVGLSDRQIMRLPEGIIGIKKTQSKKRLAELYSMADCFFNPTYEDNYPTVLLEAQACGTPVVTYNTGGCAEALFLDQSVVVNDYSEALSWISQMNVRS